MAFRLPNPGQVVAGVTRRRVAPSSHPAFMPMGLAKREPSGRAPGLPPGIAKRFATHQPQTSPFVNPTAPPMMLMPVQRVPSPGATIDVVRGTVQSAFANTLPATPTRPPNVPANYGLGDDDDDFAQFGGFSLKGLVKSVGHAVTAVGHTVGSAVTSKVGQGILGGALALTGVGAPAAAAIFATTKGVGSLIKPGGNIKHALTGAAQGAVEGVVASAAGTIGRKVIGAVTSHPTTAIQAAQQVAGRGTTTSAIDVGGGQTVPFTVNDAAMTAAINAASQHAEDAQAGVSDVAQQGNGIQAQIAQAQTTGNDQAVAQLQQAYLEQQQQLAAAQAAAAAAAQAASALQSGSGGGLTAQQVAGYVGAAAQGNAAAQIASAAPFTPDGTAAAQQAADQAAAATMDAGTGTSTDSGGGLLSHPMLLVGGLAVLLIVASKKKRRRAAA